MSTKFFSAANPNGAPTPLTPAQLVKQMLAQRQRMGKIDCGPDAPRARFDESRVHPDDPCQSKGYL